MAKQNEFVNYLVENMQTLGNVNARTMFGGHGIFLNGLMFGLVAEDVLFLKTDPQNNAFFEDRNLPHFVYEKKGKAMQMSYRQAPESALDDPDELHDWASRSYAAAVRARK
jgi:DNA transformation protein